MSAPVSGWEAATGAPVDIDRHATRCGRVTQPYLRERPATRKIGAHNHLVEYVSCVDVVATDVDATGLEIIELLRADARRTLADIAGRVSLSSAAVKRRIDRLERDG